jgi:nitronate monooxygenase
MDPDHLPQSDPSKMNFATGSGATAKAWKDIWGCGQGIGAIHEVMPAAEMVARFKREYAQAKARLCGG